MAAAASGQYYRAHPDPHAALCDHVIAGRKGFLLENGGRRLTEEQKFALRKQFAKERARAQRSLFAADGSRIPPTWNGAEWVSAGDPDGPGSGAEITRKGSRAVSDSGDDASSGGPAPPNYCIQG